jgi:hypothetical protein
MAVANSRSYSVSDNWSQSNDIPAAIGSSGPAVVVLLMVAMLELFGLAQVLQAHVAQARGREHARAMAPFPPPHCAVPGQPSGPDCRTRLSVAASPRSGL